MTGTRKRKELIILTLILFLAIIIRLFGVTQIPISDESTLVFFQQWHTLPESLIEDYHPPIFELLNSALYNLFGTNHLFLRITMLLFGVITIIFTYLIAKEKYDKKTAIISLLLISFSFWHILASLQIERDGALLTSFFALSVYFLLRYEKRKTSKYLPILCGISIGMAFLVKASALILIAFCFLYILITKKSLIKTIKFLFIPYSIALLMILFYFLLLYLFNMKELIFLTISYVIQVSSGFNPNLFFHLILWGTPLIVFSAFIKVFKYEKKDLIFYLWIFVSLLMFLRMHPLAAFDRYLMIIIPPLCILSGRLFSSIKLSKAYIYSIITGVVLYFLFLMNLKVKYIPHNLNSYFQRLITLDWHFYFPITGASGPSFGISFYAIILSILISTISISIFIFADKLKWTSLAKKFFSIFIIVSLALNFYYVINYLHPLYFPNVTQTTEDVINYYNDNKLDGILISNVPSLFLYLKDKREGEYYQIIHGISPSLLNISSVKEILSKEKAHVIFINYPPIDHQNDIYQLISQKCNLIKFFEHKSIKTAEIYNCANLLESH